MIKKRKRDGSSILLVLAITLILSAIGGVAVTSIISTTKSNHNTKVNEDLLYAAESGLESAYSKVKSKEVILSNGNSYPIYNINSLFLNEGIEVEVDIKRQSDVYRVKSTSKKDGKEKTVNGSLNVTKGFVPSDNRIFRYILCAERVNIECSGPLDPKVTLWNVKDKAGSNITHNNGIHIEPSIDNSDFIIPNFNFERTNSFIVKSMVDLDIKSGQANSGIRKLVYSKEVSSNLKKDFNIYLVNLNSPNDYIEFQVGNLYVENTIIITNGILKINNESRDMTAAPPLVLTNSTILARELNLKVSSFHSTFRLIQNDDMQFDSINYDDVDKINDLITGVTGNWNGNVGTSSEEDIAIGDIKYE